MSRQKDPSKREQQSTYFVQDRSNEEELARLCTQDKMLTASMGGVLPEQSDLIPYHRVLDVGCGTGGWLITLAQTHPGICELIGVDISTRMIAFAREQAQSAQVEDRVEFQAGDVLLRIDFLDNFFDLVNQRLGMSYVRTWEWPKLLQEYQRVTRPGGIIRITEASTTMENTSSALTRIVSLAHEANELSGRLFTSDPESVIKELPRLMEQHGIADVQTQTYHLVYRAGTPEGQSFAEDMAALFHVGLPFLNKWTNVPDDFDALCQQAIQEMQQSDFVATWTFLTAWGHVASR